jgi:hypothetical protein
MFSPIMENKNKLWLEYFASNKDNMPKIWPRGLTITIMIMNLLANMMQ